MKEYLSSIQGWMMPEKMLSIERACKEKNLDIQFEFSGLSITQRNWKVEGKSLNLYGCVRSMLNDTGIKEEIRRSI
jgi:hypothetical protein